MLRNPAYKCVVCSNKDSDEDEEEEEDEDDEIIERSSDQGIFFIQWEPENYRIVRRLVISKYIFK